MVSRGEGTTSASINPFRFDLSGVFMKFSGKKAGGSALFSCPRDGIPGFFVGGAAALGFAFIPELLAFRQSKFNFDLAVLEVHAGGDQREPLLLGFPDQFANLFFVNQEFSGAQGRMVGGVSMVVGSYVAVEEPEFSVFDEAVGVFQIRGAGANGLYLGSGEHDSGFEFF